MKSGKRSRINRAILILEYSVNESMTSLDDLDIIESEINKIKDLISIRRSQIIEDSDHRYVKAGDLKSILKSIPDDAKIKLGQEGNEYSAIDVKYDEELKSVLIQ